MARRSFNAEFTTEAVRSVQRGKRSITAVAREAGIGQPALSRWLKQFEVDEGRGPDGELTTFECDELHRLRRDLKRAQDERDIPKKGTAFFAK